MPLGAGFWQVRVIRPVATHHQLVQSVRTQKKDRITLTHSLAANCHLPPHAVMEQADHAVYPPFTFSVLLLLSLLPSLPLSPVLLLHSPVQYYEEEKEKENERMSEGGTRLPTTT